MIDATIIGAGPAGVSCALWLAQCGLRCIVLDQAARPFSSLHTLDFSQNWVLGHRNTSTSTLADIYTSHLAQEPLIELRCNTHIEQAIKLDSNKKVLLLSDGSQLETKALILATGLRARRFSGSIYALRNKFYSVFLFHQLSGSNTADKFFRSIYDWNDNSLVRTL